jgi:hypothetical protein
LRLRIRREYVADMSSIYSSGFEPDPHDALDVLAFVLCPAQVFAPAGDDSEMQAVEELIAPAKAEAVKRWYEAFLRRTQN